MDKDVFVEPPADIKKEGLIGKLVIPLYSLKDESWKIWLRIKEIFKTQGLRTVGGDDAFYFKNIDGNLEGMVLTHVDDFAMTGTEGFLGTLEKN